jgi:hypothetical protein
MGAQQPKQFRRSKLRRISAVGELMSGRDSKAFQMVGDQVANDNAAGRSRIDPAKSRETDQPACVWLRGTSGNSP